MSDELKITDIDKEPMKEPTEKKSAENVEAASVADTVSRKPNKRRKKGKAFLRVVILVVLFCLVVFAGIILSDVFFGGQSADNEPEITVIKVSGQNIILNENNVTLDGLDKYLSELDKSGELSTVALINDTAAPADPEVYNKIVALLGKYGIVCETLPIVSTDDEASTDELIPATVHNTEYTEASSVTLAVTSE